MSDDLVERLQARALALTESPMMSAVREQVEWEAGERIEELEAQVKTLRGYAIHARDYHAPIGPLRSEAVRVLAATEK